MLAGMTAKQYQEWLAFFAIRAEQGQKPQGGYKTDKEGQNRLSGDIIRAMTGYQNRRAGAV
jgi:hypothetical protein